FGGHQSFYLSRFGILDAASLHTFEGQGNAFGIHPYAAADGFTLSQGFASALSWYTSTYASQPSAVTRIHQLNWQGWSDGAAVEEDNGIGMDLDFYLWGPTLKNSQG